MTGSRDCELHLTSVALLSDPDPPESEREGWKGGKESQMREKSRQFELPATLDTKPSLTGTLLRKVSEPVYSMASSKVQKMFTPFEEGGLYCMYLSVYVWSLICILPQ